MRSLETSNHLNYTLFHFGVSFVFVNLQCLGKYHDMPRNKYFNHLIAGRMKCLKNDTERQIDRQTEKDRDI